MKVKEKILPCNQETSGELAEILNKYLFEYNKRKTKNKKLGEPIIVCVGSDLAIFDSLGPLCGTLLKEKMPDVCFFGDLEDLRTAKNIQVTAKYIKKTYPNCPVITIDAALSDTDIGGMIIKNQPMRPGIGANKSLGQVGDFSIMGLTKDKSEYFRTGIHGHTTRLGMIYKMADVISDGLVIFLTEWRKNNQMA